MDWALISKTRLVRNLLQDYNRGVYTVSTRKHELQGNILWSIHDVKDKTGAVTESFIRCAYMESVDGGWSWKTIPEAMQPYYYGVPLSWLDEVPTSDDKALIWRGLVRRLAGQPSTVAELAEA